MAGDDHQNEVPSDPTRFPKTRRRVLQGAASASVLAGLGFPTAAQQQRIVLGGNTSGWEGREPQEIEGETNPTLELEEGTTYVVEWENVDGQPHNFVIEDADGNDIVRTPVLSTRGEVQTVEFEATRAMSEYYCEVHPQSMRGDVSLGEAAEDGADEPQEQARYFEEGAAVGVQTVAEGLTAPTDFAATAGGELLMIADQTGEIWIADGETPVAAPVADISDRMVDVGESFAGSYADPEQDYDERGLLGIELHPNFMQNGRLFLHYSAPPDERTPDGWSHVEVVSEFGVDLQAVRNAESLDDLRDAVVDAASEQRLMEFQKPQYNHDGGPIAFGPDGYLYVPMGDGGGANDEMYGHVDDWYDGNAGGNGQDTIQNALGGIHRIDVDSTEGDRPYGIPDDNPLVDMEGHIDEYYAWGFRNPFGITFDDDGEMIVADAGQNLYEEANVVEKGGNYGWNVKEGTHCFSTDDPGQPPEECPTETPEDVRGGEELIDPVVEYPHNYEGSPVGIVITGGHVYEAGDVADLRGKYIFGDWTRDVARETPDGRVFAATPGRGRGPPDDGRGDGGDGGDGRGDGGDGRGDGGGGGRGDGGDGGRGDGGRGDGGDSGRGPPDEIPRDRLWEMEELVFAGSPDGNLNRFVRQFGQGPNGEVYVLVNQRGVPEGNTGEVLELVPPGQGEDLPPPETPESGG